MKVELTPMEMQVIRSALRRYTKTVPMNNVGYVLFERFTSILLGDD